MLQRTLNCHITLFVLHRVTEHLITDFSCCSYLYEEFTCFHFSTFVRQTLCGIQEFDKFVKYVSFVLNMSRFSLSGL